MVPMRFALLLALSLSACSATVVTGPKPSPSPSASPSANPSPGPSATPTPGPTSSPTANPASLDQDLRLKYRQPVQIPSEKLQISYEALIQDSRCPSDVQCVRAGDVTVKLKLSQNGSELGQPELTFGAGADKAIAKVGDYQVSLVKVEPESKLSTQHLQASDYTLTVRVSKVTASDSVSANLGQPFDLKYQQSALIASEKLKL
ncbi:MAG: hypothetical protein ACAI44_05730, partial [Candidatus Sericytochromatia bacterium]